MEETDSVLEQLDLCIDEAYQHGAPVWHSPAQGGSQPSRPDHNFFLHNLQHGARIDFYRGVAADDLQNTTWKRWFSQLLRYQTHVARSHGPASVKSIANAMELVAGLSYTAFARGSNLPAGHEVKFPTERSRQSWACIWHVFEQLGLTVTPSAAGASSSSGGEHPALFDAADLHFFDLAAEDADETKLRRSYHKKSLSTHPDKGGCKEAFQNLGFLYEKLKQGFKTLRALQEDIPNATVASVTTSVKKNDHSPRDATELAPAWNVRDILQPVLPLIRDAVRGIVQYLDVMPDTLHDALRKLAVRHEYTCHLRGVGQPAE